MADAENIPDIDHGLASLTEETTAAEFLRSKGQHKKVKTINKEKLKQWITQAIGQTRAGMANAYNDEEKEELLKKTQEQLEEVMARAAKAEAEVRTREGAKADMASEIEALQARAADAEGREDKTAELSAAMLTITKLQDQYHTAHKEAEDLRLDVYELQDQLNTKMALSRTTMEEKDRLKETMQGLMVRAGDLTGGVLHLDQDYYAGQHAAESVISEDAELTEQFFHDFEVGAKVIDSLSNDLSKLREITTQQAEDAANAADEAEKAAAAPALLSTDLALLEQLKSGSLSAVDVAQPVGGLIEALNGARDEALTLEKEAAEAMGMPQTAGTVSALPDADGDPAEVLAGATAVSRELAALFAKERNRISALQMMIDEADSARNSEEADAEQQLKSYDALLAKIATQSQAAGLSVDDSINNADADADSREAAADKALAALSEQATQAEVAKFYHALLQNIKQQAEELGIATDASMADEKADKPARNAAAAQAVLELAQKAADTSVIERYDALLGDIAEQAEVAGVTVDAALADVDADSGKRNAAAAQALAAVAQKATDERVQNNYDALLERIAEEAKESEIDVTIEALTNNDFDIDDRQAEAEKALSALAEKSASAEDIVALQEQLDEALHDANIIDAVGEEEPVSEDLVLDEAKAKSDHDAVRTLVASRIARLLGKIKELEDEKGAETDAKESLSEQLTEKEVALAAAAEEAGRKAMEVEEKEAALVAAAEEAERKAAEAAEKDIALAAAIEEASRKASEAEEKEAALQTALAQIESNKDDKPHEKELARAVMKAVQGDEDLAGDDAVLDLALAIDDYNDEIAEDEDAQHLVDQSAAVIRALGVRKLELMTELAQIKASQLDRDAKVDDMARMKTEAETERDEMAESGKEIISQLTQQRDAKVKEADEAKQRLHAHDVKLNELEESIHGFADQLANLADDEEGQSESVAAAKTRVRDALAQMPGEKSVPLQASVANEVTQAGIALADALSSDGGAKARGLQEDLVQAQSAAAEKVVALAAIQAAVAEKDAAVQQLEQDLKEKQDELAKVEQDLKAKEDEIAQVTADKAQEQQQFEQDLKAKDDEIAQVKTEKDTEVATAQAEAEEVAAGGKEVIEHLNQQRDKQQQEIDALQAKVERLAEAEEANRKMAEQISSLAAIAGQQQGGEEIGDMQADLEVTLSEVPGDEEVPVREGLSKDLAESSVAIVDTIRDQLAERAAALAKVEAERDDLKGVLRQSRAAIEEYRARNEESSSSNEGDLKDLSQKLSDAEKAKDKIARELQEQIDDYRLEENVLKKKVDELNKQVLARDEEILAIKREEDSGADRQVELSSLREQNQALEAELKESKAKLDAYEAAQSAVGGKEEFAVGGLKSEVNKLRQEREDLRTRMRSVEDELATEKSRVEGLKEDRQNLRSEFDQERSVIQSDLEREKTAHGQDVSELKKLRSDLAGAQARVRALSESGDEDQV